MGSRRRSRRAVASFTAAIAMAAAAHAQSIVRVDVANDGSETQGQVTSVDVSADGTKVVFASDAYGLDPADVNYFRDVLVRDLAAGTTTLVSTRSNGKLGDGHSDNPRISADGRFVAFESDATDLVGMDRNGKRDVFVKELSTGITRRVSVASDGTEADGASELLAISSDGNRVLFVSYADNLVAGDANGWADLFLRDLAAGTTTRVSTASDGSEADFGGYGGDLSPDGRFVLISSLATNLVVGDTNSMPDVFWKDLSTGDVLRASVDANGAELPDGAWSVIRGWCALSPDGRRIAFVTIDAIDPADGNTGFDTYLRDLDAGTTTILSVDSSGNVPPTKLYGGTSPRAISSDARFVLLEGDAVDLADDGGTDNYQNDVYVRDRDLAMTTRQDNDASGTAGDGWTGGSRMTPDARQIVFVSDAPSLVDGKTETGYCAYLVTRPYRDAASNSYGSGFAGTSGIPSLDCAAPLRLNQPYDIGIGNSLGTWTAALLLIGIEPAQLPTSFGGDLLVLPSWTQFLVIAPGGFHLTGTVPPDERLAATGLFLQALEIDAGAPRGISFTAGLELEVGF
jgi:Tol biopolymer transport system component